MKKSKIILPAIALLAVSGIASVTGTVAWFTASQSANVTLNNVVALNTVGNLTAEFAKDTAGNLTNAYGFTTEETGASTAITGTFGALRDASVDVSNNNQIYAANFDVLGTTDETASISGYDEISANSNVKDKDGTTVWYAVQFDIKFTVANVGEEDAYSLFFLPKESALNYTSTASKVAPAFRAAMEGTDGTLVWAPRATAETMAGGKTGLKYVNGTTADDTDYYEIGKDAITTDTSAPYTTANISDGNDSILCLNAGHITASKTTETVHFVFWFEGSDSACLAANADKVVGSLAMSFYAVKN